MNIYLTYMYIEPYRTEYPEDVRYIFTRIRCIVAPVSLFRSLFLLDLLSAFSCPRFVIFLFCYLLYRYVTDAMRALGRARTGKGRTGRESSGEVTHATWGTIQWDDSMAWAGIGGESIRPSHRIPSQLFPSTYLLSTTTTTTTSTSTTTTSGSNSHATCQ